jgi:uncharacterized protein YndB with AHSA1/START domain
MTTRVDTASRIIAASAQAIYDAFIDPECQARWLPPTGMTGRFDRFEAYPGGHYRMVLTYADGGAAHPGKSAADADIAQGRFIVLEPGSRIVQTADFVSDDPAFAGTMTIEWALAPVTSGTRVTVAARDVPPGISAEDHVAGLTSTLANLAEFIE